MGDVKTTENVLKYIEYLYSNCGVGLNSIRVELKEEKGVDLNNYEIGKLVDDLNLQKGVVFSEEEIVLIKTMYDRGSSVSTIIGELVKSNKYRKSTHLKDYIALNDLAKGSKWSDSDIAILEEYYPIGGYKLCVEKGLTKDLYAVSSKVRQLGLKVGKVSKRWTDEDIEYLKEKVAILSISEMCEELDRSVASVSKQISRLGLSVQNAWTNKEDSIILKYYEDGGSVLCIEKGLKRTDSAIKSRAHLFGLVMFKKWTDEEDAILRECYPVGGSPLCIEKGIDRDLKSIQSRAFKLKVKSGLKPKSVEEWDLWTDKEVSLLHKYYVKGGYPLCKSKGLKKSNMATVNKARNLGIRSGAERGWSDKDVQILKDYYLSEGINGCRKRGIEYADITIYTKVRELGLNGKRKL